MPTSDQDLSSSDPSASATATCAVAASTSHPRAFEAGISGLGFYVPERVLTNEDLARFLATNDEWIRSRTGIGARRVAAPDESTADIAEKAARRALDDAGVTPEQIQMVIVATCTPDYQFPSTASLLQDRLGVRGAAFDLGAACSGFVYALVTAAQFVQTGACENVLIVGAEVMSRIVDWSDRSTAVLFGDGAGAAVVSRAKEGSGVLGFDLGSDGSGGPLLKVSIAGEPAPSNLPREIAELDAASAGASTCESTESEAPPAHRRTVYQNGREVYRFAVNVMGESALRALASCGVAPESVDLFVPHQANVRIIEAAAKRLGLGSDKVFVNVDRYGNTSAASVPIALCEARDEGRVKPGDTVVMVGFGAGLTWASAVVRWS
jgi:3-oxoacyl-[acyl-carrier-protein] synthase-3